MRRMGDEHEAVTDISTRFALHDMRGSAAPELLLYTEDRLAAVLAEEALGGSLRSRVRLSDVGSSCTLARQAVSHLRAGGEVRAFCLYDSATTENQIQQWIASERGERQDL